MEIPKHFSSHHIKTVDKSLSGAEAAAWKLVVEVGEEEMRPVLYGLLETIQTFKEIRQKREDAKGKKKY